MEDLYATHPPKEACPSRAQCAGVGVWGGLGVMLDRAQPRPHRSATDRWSRVPQVLLWSTCMYICG